MDELDLTKAQKRAMLELPDEFRMWPVSISRVTIKRLIELGMLETVRTTTGFGLTLHRWTPSGLSARAAITAAVGEGK